MKLIFSEVNNIAEFYEIVRILVGREFSTIFSPLQETLSLWESPYFVNAERAKSNC